MASHDDLIRLTRRLYLEARKTIQPVRWRPPADVYRLRDGWLVKIELAGVRPDEVEVITQGRLLVVRGRRCDTEVFDGCEFYSMEIAYSHFQRVLELPANLDRAQTAIDYRNGMLLVRIITEAEGP